MIFKYWWVSLSNGENYGFKSKISMKIFCQLWNIANMETQARIGYEWKNTNHKAIYYEK